MGARRKRPPQTQGEQAGRLKWALHFFWLLPALLAGAAYLPALDAGRIWDDPIILDTQLPAFRTVEDVFFPPESIPQWPASYYRPLLIGSYLLDTALFGADGTRGLHATGVIYHMAVSAFVALLAMLALRGSRFRTWGSLAAGALFAVHPIHVESVSWITGRSDTLAAFFLFPAFLLATRYRDHRSLWALWLSPLLFLAACLSKEVALAGLGVLPAWLALVPPMPQAGGHQEKAPVTKSKDARRWGTPWPLLAVYGAAALVYLVFRALAGTRSGFSELIGGGFADQIGRLASALAYYLLKSVWPPPQSALVGELPGTLLTLGALALGAAAVFWAIVSARRGRTLGLLACAWFALTILPSLPVAVSKLAEAPVAERYVYIPSFSICLVFGVLVGKGLARSSWRGPTITFAVALVLVGVIGTVGRSEVWKTDLSLWSDTVEKEPRSGLAWGELGKAYLDRGSRLDLALDAYETAVEVDNDAMGRAIAYTAMGVIHSRQGKEQEAYEAWTAAVEARPDYASAWFNLGTFSAKRFETTARQQGRLDRDLLDTARSHLQRAVDLDPRYEKAWLRLVWCDVYEALAILSSGGDLELARMALSEAETSRRHLTEIDGDRSTVGQADRLLQQARQALEARAGR